jgi:predicted nucleic acid-binding protein
LIVIDASATVAWFFEDEQTPPIVTLGQQVAAHGAIVPQLWPLEVANVLTMAVRRNRLSPEKRAAGLVQLSNLPITIDAHTAARAWHNVLVLAERHALTVYDATYLDLALRDRLPLASLDKDLLAAARAEGLETLP